MLAHILQMEYLREFRTKFKDVMNTGEKVTDRWMIKNPLAFISRMRFVNNQRLLYNPRFGAFWRLGKWCLGAYVMANLSQLTFNEPPLLNRKFLTEYYVLANFIEHDRLEQFGLAPHLQKLYERGRKRGLTQIELLELVKLHEANEPAAPLISHIEYLRELKG